MACAIKLKNDFNSQSVAHADVAIEIASSCEFVRQPK